MQPIPPSAKANNAAVRNNNDEEHPELPQPSRVGCFRETANAVEIRDENTREGKREIFLIFACANTSVFKV